MTGDVLFGRAIYRSRWVETTRDCGAIGARPSRRPRSAHAHCRTQRRGMERAAAAFAGW